MFPFFFCFFLTVISDKGSPHPRSRAHPPRCICICRRVPLSHTYRHFSRAKTVEDADRGHDNQFSTPTSTHAQTSLPVHVYVHLSCVYMYMYVNVVDMHTGTPIYLLTPSMTHSPPPLTLQLRHKPTNLHTHMHPGPHRGGFT